MRLEEELDPEPTLWQRPAMVILLTLLAFSFLMGLGGLLGGQITQLMGVDVGSLMKSTEDYQFAMVERQGIRWFNMIAHLIAFTSAALLIAWLARGDRSIGSFLQLENGTSSKVLGLAIVSMLLGMPAIQLVTWLNSIIELPASLQLMEDSQTNLVAAVLQMESPGELMTALLVAAVAPAIGEELLFRGVLQPQFQRLVNHPQWGIWITAALFSAIHLQFAGFFPRMILGAFLGYLLWWSGSLWLPIVIHFLFNGMQVLAAYLKPDLFTMAEEIEFGWQETLLGLASVGILIFLLPLLRRSAANGA